MDKFRNAIRKAKHEHPILLPTLLVASFASLCWLAILSYDELTREQPKLGAFPPAVEQHLRDAIFYTEIKPQPSLAAEFFTRAIAQAEREEMDPFSAAFTGIHIRFAAALEKFGQAKGAIEVLDRLVSDLVERIEDIDLGRTTQRRTKQTGSMDGEVSIPDVISTAGTSSDISENERGRLLKQVIECKVKISNLYESDYIQDESSAKRILDEAMKLLVESMRDPKSLQFDENRAGISADEAAALLSQVGDSNIKCLNFGTALESFKLALIAVRKANRGKPSCREAFTLSNMFMACAMMLDSPDPVIDGKPATQASIKQAHKIMAGWAHHALQCTQAVEPAEQDSFCAMAVMTSWNGLASTLTELGDLKGARGMWEQVIQKSESQSGLRDLVPIAEAGLKVIDEKERRRP